MTSRPQFFARAALPSLLLVISSPALAQDNEYTLPGETVLAAAQPVVQPHLPARSLPPQSLPSVTDAPIAIPPVPPEAPYAVPATYQVDPRAREAWLTECRRRTAEYYGGGRNNGGIIGALVGGLAGGIIGNRIDDGPDRAGGTIGGAVLGGVVGAVAGNAIGKASQRSRSNGYDYCEAYFDDYYRQYNQARPAPAPAYYAPSPAARPCTEEVVYEYVPVTRSRTIRRPAPHRAAPRVIRDKRVRIN